MLEVVEVGNKISKDEYNEIVPDLRLNLINAQYDLRQADFPVIIWIAGDDRIGANQMVNRINEWMDARYIDTHVFGAPTEEEELHPALWRLWQAMPPKGRTALMAGGLMRMVTMRLDDEINDEQFDRWVRHIATMQNEWVADGAMVLKFFLHTPEKKQRKKLRRAAKDPQHGWWVDERDWKVLDLLGPAIPLVEHFVRETSAPGAPWTMVEATDARYRDVTVARTTEAALRARLAHTVTPGPAVSESIFGEIEGVATVLSGVDLSLKLDRDAYRRELDHYQGKLHRLAHEARQRGVGTVLAFEGADAGGKGGVIRRVTAALEAGNYRVIPVAAPTEEERRYQYLWRFWRYVPPAGRTVIFDRTWYGRVLVERVEGFADASEWQRAYDEINDFEEQLVERGDYVAKFWLHISPEEQLARFKAREDTPYKQHKITDEDWRNREKWDDYVRAVDQMVQRTTSDHAQWHVIPANDKYYARIAVLKAITKGLKEAIARA